MDLSASLRLALFCLVRSVIVGAGVGVVLHVNWRWTRFLALPASTDWSRMPSPRLGLCCLFRDQPIKFVTTTATAIGRMRRPDAVVKLSRLCLANADALLASLRFCADNQIGCFRINSQILPIKTHPDCGYSIGDLPASDEIVRRFKECRQFAQKHDVRTCFHPDQFVVLNSPRVDVVEKSVEGAGISGGGRRVGRADVINIHAGGAYGDKQKALADFARNLERLSHRARIRLTVENDDKTFTPADLLPVCKAEGLPFVYDVHHHRCNPDGLSIEQVTRRAIATWNREPMFHISSPLNGWKGPKLENDITTSSTCKTSRRVGGERRSPSRSRRRPRKLR